MLPLQNGEDDHMVYPDELEVLLKKRIAFRVKVQPNFNQGSVQKLLTDASSVDQILENYIKQQDEQTKDIVVNEPKTPTDTLVVTAVIPQNLPTLFKNSRLFQKIECL